MKTTPSPYSPNLPYPLIVILGPTSSGKSTLGIKLARKFRGEIVSADSRQVYIGMDLGTGKVTKQEQKMAPHHLLDIIFPKKQYSASEYKRDANVAIKNILDRNKVPFLVGGTPFYIYSVADDLSFPEVAPNPKLRAQLEKKTTAQLLSMLKKLDPRRAETIEQQNPHRLIRAIEIVKATGQPVPLITKKKSPYSLLILGLNPGNEKLFKLIDNRIEKRLKAGMVKEVKKLLKSGVTYKRLFEMGLEYRFVSEHLRGRLTYDQMKAELKTASHKFARRQMTWFRSDSRIKWITTKNQAEQHVRKFLKYCRI